ncbi:hypothetical protein ACOMHN_023078 [Nucella lapillus]
MSGVGTAVLASRDERRGNSSAGGGVEMSGVGTAVLVVESSGTGNTGDVTGNSGDVTDSSDVTGISGEDAET